MVSGIILQSLAHIPLLYYAPLLLLAAMGALWERRLLYLIVLVFSAVNLQLRIPTLPEHVGYDLIYSGIVMGEDNHEHFTRLLVQIDHVMSRGDTIKYRTLAEFYVYEDGVFTGKRLFIRGRMKRARSIYRPNLLNGRIVSHSSPRSLFGVFGPLRNYIDDLLRKILGPDHYPIGCGLILGGSRRLNQDLKDVFGRAGILHILAVSGLHVGFVALFFGLLLFSIPVDHRIKFLIVMTGLFVYAGVVGFRPSVCRAATMAFLFGMARVLQRNVDHLHILNVTALLFLFINPLLVFDVGAQLSFAAVYGILYLYPKIDAQFIKRLRRRYLRFLLRSMAVSFSAQVFVAPLLVFYFHRLPVYVVFANLIILPLAAAIIFTLFVCFLTAWLWSGFASVISYPLGVTISMLVTISRLFARMPMSVIQFSLSPLLLLPLYSLLWGKIRRIVLFLLPLIALGLTIAASADCIMVCAGAESVLVIMPCGERILVCARQNASQRIFLEKCGTYHIDFLLAPSRYYPARRQYIAWPGKMQYKRVLYRDLEIKLSENLLLDFRGSTRLFPLSIEANDRGGDGITFWLSNGDQELVVRGSLYPSIFDQSLTEAQIAFCRLRMLF